jgi:OOP family OmpA-OmpF porin
VGDRLIRRLILVTVLLLTCASPALAAPRQDHFDPFVQKPATSPLGLFTLEGAAAGDGLEWLALRMDYAHGLFGLVGADGKLLGNVIPDRLDAHLLASFAYKRFLSLGIDLPITLYQADGFDVVRNIYRRNQVAESTVAGLFPPLSHQGLGDIRLVPKIALPIHRPISLAVVPELRLRTGASSSFLGDALGPIHGHAGPIFCPRLEGEATVWRMRVLAELGYQLRGEEQYFNLTVGDQLTFGAGAELALPYVRVFNNWEVIAEFTGNTQVKKPFTFNDSNKYETPLELVGGLRARLRHGIVAYAGVGSGLSGGGYGRELFRAFALVGWEPPNSDSTVPVPDDEMDSDHDGVPDGMDRCPSEPGSIDTDGCPDRDGDGIPDIDDRCPDEPGPAENLGCHVEGPTVVYAPPHLKLNVPINFETGSANIKRESYPVVDAVAAFLRDHPEIKKILVEGHTDNRGSAKVNLDLSKRRARSVLERLEKDGIAITRMDSEGFGFERPVASNDTALGRARNRRVDFTVTDPVTGIDKESREQVITPSAPEKPAPTPAPPK